MIRNRPIPQLLAVCLAATLLPQSVPAFPKTDEEFARLPPYCRARMREDSTSPIFKQWQSTLGPKNFIHIHHYCSALNYVNNAINITKKIERQRALSSAIGGFQYVQDKAEPTFFLHPEISVQKGKALLKLGRIGEAVAEFTAAIEFKRDYTPAYGALADLHIEQGDKEKAREILEQGLAASPRSKSLRRRLSKLSGS